MGRKIVIANQSEHTVYLAVSVADASLKAYLLTRRPYVLHLQISLTQGDLETKADPNTVIVSDSEDTPPPDQMSPSVEIDPGLSVAAKAGVHPELGEIILFLIKTADNDAQEGPKDPSE